MFLPAMRHRVILNFEAQAEGIDTDQVLLEILQKVPEKAEDAQGRRRRRMSECRIANDECQNSAFAIDDHSVILHSDPASSCPSTESKLLPPDLMAQLERLELVTRKVFRGRMKGERRSKRKGQSVEFADFRSYVPGDDLRSLDWNLYARLDKLIVKLFLEEEDLHFFTLIDASLSMDFGEPTKLQYAKQLAAALGFVGLIRTDRVRIETLGQSVQQPRARCSAAGASVWRMLEYLDGIEPGETASLAEGVKNFCLRNAGKGIVVLITDLMDKNGYEAALRYLVSQRMDVYVIHVLSQEELDPGREGRPQAGRLRGPGHRRNHGQCPAVGTLQVDAQRVRGRRAGVLQPPRHELPACQQSDAGEGFDWKLFATTRTSAVDGREISPRRHEEHEVSQASFECLRVLRVFWCD